MKDSSDAGTVAEDGAEIFLDPFVRGMRRNRLRHHDALDTDRDGTATNALAVRAVSGTTIVTASAVTSWAHSHCRCRGAQYRLEMLASNGVEPVVTSGSRVVVFRGS